jgi:hypothetical protein
MIVPTTDVWHFFIEYLFLKTRLGSLKFNFQKLWEKYAKYTLVFYL